jgi:hypothetical protein
MNTNWLLGFYIVGLPLLLLALALWVTIRLTLAFSRWHRTQWVTASPPAYTARTRLSSEVHEFLWAVFDFGMYGLGALWKSGVVTQVPLWLVIPLAVLSFVRLLNLAQRGFSLLANLARKTSKSLK